MISTGDDGFHIEIRTIWPEGAWPCFSPDGRELAFTGLLDQPYNVLMIMPMDGGGEPRVVSPPRMTAKRPAWLPSGDEIVFNRDQLGIWTLDPTTHEVAPFLTEATPDASTFFHPCAYPGERAVAVVSFRDTAAGREGVLYKLAPGAAQPRLQLTSYPEVCAGRPGVGPDGETLVFAGNAGRCEQGANQLWIVRPDERPRRLEQGERHLAQGRGPRWSPDGRWIACTSTRPEPKPNERTRKAIWIVSADGGAAYRLTDHAFDPLHVAWSSDQKRLACGGVGCGLGLLDLPPLFHRGGEAGRDEPAERGRLL